MQDYIQILKTNITHALPDGWDSITRLLYRCYDSRGESASPRIREYNSIIAKNTKELPYEIQDQISSAAVGLCVEYERIAFADGVAIGAKLILELLCEQV